MERGSDYVLKLDEIVQLVLANLVRSVADLGRLSDVLRKDGDLREYREV